VVKKFDLSDLVLLLAFAVVTVRLYGPLYTDYKREKSAQNLFTVSALMINKLNSDARLLIAAHQPVSVFLPQKLISSSISNHIRVDSAASLDLDGGFSGIIIKLTDEKTQLSSIMVKSDEKKLFQILEEGV